MSVNIYQTTHVISQKRVVAIVTDVGIPDLAIYVITNFPDSSSFVPKVINIYYSVYIKLIDGY
jgi:hypothetical protein